MDDNSTPQPPKKKRVRVRKPPYREVKRCLGPCHKNLPNTEQYFARSAKRPDGYKTWCKECLAERRKGVLDTHLQATMTKLDFDILGQVMKSGTGGSNLPHVTQLMEVIISQLGGVQGMGMYYVANLLASPPGSQTRERMLNKLLEFVKGYSADDKVNKPRELLTDEELEERINQAERLRIVNGDARQAG